MMRDAMVRATMVTIGSTLLGTTILILEGLSEFREAPAPFASLRDSACVLARGLPMLWRPAFRG